jgi:hypothetical protein
MRWIFAVFIITVISTISSVSEAAEPTPLERYQREAPVAWSKLIDLASCVEGEVFSKKIDLRTGKIISQTEPQPFRINGLLACSPIPATDAKKEYRMLCQNLDYEFIVGKSRPRNGASSSCTGWTVMAWTLRSNLIVAKVMEELDSCRGNA